MFGLVYYYGKNILMVMVVFVQIEQLKKIKTVVLIGIFKIYYNSIPVCITLIELADSFTSLDIYKASITTYISEVLHSNSKPHFIITPSYPELANYSINLLFI